MEQAQAGVELTKAYAGRPAFVAYKGGRVALAIRDGAYLLERRAWRQRLAAAHPDKGGTATRFEKIKRQYDAWEAAERRGFAELGWPPPRASDGQVTAKPDGEIADIFRARTWRRGSERQRILAFVRANPETSRADVAAALGVDRGRVHAAVHTDRKSGRLPPTKSQIVAALLRDGLPHPIGELAAALKMTEAETAPLVSTQIYQLRKRHGVRIATVILDGKTLYQLIGSLERQDV